MGAGFWTQVYVEGGSGIPRTDSSHANQMVYDPVADLVLLYGNNGFTYQWDGTTFIQLATTPDVGVPMVWFDENNGAPLMFGGVPNVAGFNETYLWDWGLSAWSLLSPSVKPSIRAFSGIAYDQGRANAIMFGGLAGGTSASFASSQTWQWDGSDWTLLSPSTVPPARFFTSMAYDPIRDRVVMFGGRSSTNVLLNDTWTWDGTDWTLESPGTSPSGRESFSMCWDPLLGMVVLYGGDSIGSAYLDETWGWDGSDWTDLTSTLNDPLDPPLPTQFPGLCFYTSRNELTMLTCRYGPSGFYKGDVWVVPQALLVQVMRWW